jgi:hypothetical protein
VLKQRILTWFPNSGLVNASSVGAKNMASSSGWAMRRHIRLLYSVGKPRINGDEPVADSDQKPMRRTGMSASTHRVVDTVMSGVVGLWRTGIDEEGVNARLNNL